MTTTNKQWNTAGNNMEYDCGLTRPPHGWQYVEAENEKEAK